MRCRLISSLLAIPVALAFASPAPAGLIANPGFDTAVPANDTGGGWTSVNIDFAGGWESTGGNPGAFFAINDDGDANTDPRIEQTVRGLSIGETYVVTGDFKVNILEQGSPADSFEVRLDASPIATFDAPGPLGQWFPFSASFQASSTQHTLAFAAETNGSDYDYGLDNVAIVPAPATLALLGFGGLALCRRRGRAI